MKISATISQWRRTWGHLTPVRRLLFFIVVMLMFVSAFAETISIASVLPFIVAITNPDVLLNHPHTTKVVGRLGIESERDFVLLVTIFFCVAAIGAGVIRLGAIWLEERLAVRIGADFGSKIYRNVLNRPYLEHCTRNSSEVVSALTAKLGTTVIFFRSILAFLRSILIVSIVSATLLIIDPVLVLVSVGSIGLIYILIARFFKSRMESVSQSISREANRVVSTVQTGIGGIRDIILDGSQEVFLTAFNRANQTLRKAQATAVVIGNSPYYIIQAFGIVAIAGLAYHLTQRGTAGADPLALLGMIALAASRLFPVAQEIYRSWAAVFSARDSVDDILIMLDQTPHDNHLHNTDPIKSFRKKIELVGVFFSYGPNLPSVLTNICLTIEKGSRIGFIGETGCGKSTLLDVIMGLLPKTKGELKIDDIPISSSNKRDWYARIAHVPQAIYLLDESIESNIAFGVPSHQIDHERVRLAADAAQLGETIRSLPDGLQTIVGENGIRLSGGQRQRVGIARALYKRAELIVLDEATSALDNETEAAVMRAIDNLDPDITVLIVAHRLTTLKNCTSIIEMTKDGVEFVRYEDIVSRN